MPVGTPVEEATSIAPTSPSSSPSPPATDSRNKKRSSASITLDKNGNPKPVKRRAAKACAACRARKVRCDVTQRYHITADGAPTCSNCTMDGIQCVIEESKRRKKHLQNGTANGAPAPQPAANGNPQAWTTGVVNLSDIQNPDARRWSNSQMSIGTEPGHVPHPIYRNASQQLSQGEILKRASYIPAPVPYDSQATMAYSLLTSASMTGDRTATRIDPSIPPPPLLKHQLPEYLKPLPQRMTSVDIDYLFAKGALSLPDIAIRNALLRSYMDYVHPYMPLINANEILQIIDDGTGASGTMSLLLFQSIMFAGTAFVDMDMLKLMGFTNRKAARKAFFQKARVLYDFDYEIDREALVQSLLLMTYWYETPDDQKDTWHWMGVAISLAHTIGLHRDPGKSNMDPRKKRLWKRIWWSCFMRDRLIALGMRRPTRVKDEDYDVPMLTEDDFDISALPRSISIFPMQDCLARDVEGQRRIAQMCIAKAKLCLCISHVLSAQYSVLIKSHGMQQEAGSTRSSVMLFPKKIDQTDEVRCCDGELTDWIRELPATCMYSNELTTNSSGAPLFVQRSLLHMIYFTTLSALHRPQVLPSPATPQSDSRELQDLSRKKVREASREITRISQDLLSRGLERYLPTTGVTVLLPAIIIHLLDIKSANDEARNQALNGFVQCMNVLESLRENYASADFATQFLDAAIKKADLDGILNSKVKPRAAEQPPTPSHSDTRRSSRMPPAVNRQTPPPDPPTTRDSDLKLSIESDARDKHMPAHTPPDSDTSAPLTFCNQPSNSNSGASYLYGVQADIDLGDFLNIPGSSDPFEEGVHGESGGFMADLDWSGFATGMSRVGSPLMDDFLFKDDRNDGLGLGR